MVARAALAVALVACTNAPSGSGSSSSASANSASAGSSAAGAGSSAASRSSAGAGSAGPGSAARLGDLQVRVEWPKLPVVARSSPGRTPCNTPRAPAVAPTTTWGIPDALVIVDGAKPAAGEARVTLADCALTPRVAIGATLAITSAVDRPARLILRKRGPLAKLVAGDAVAIQLPIAGHSVTLALEPNTIYSLETDAPDPELAFVANVAGAVTEANGQVTLRDLSLGAHAVTAWLPPRAAQPARSGRATATITVGDLVDLTVPLAP